MNATCTCVQPTAILPFFFFFIYEASNTALVALTCSRQSTYRTAQAAAVMARAALLARTIRACMCMIVLIASLLPPTCIGSALWRSSGTGDKASRADGDATSASVWGPPAARPPAHVPSTTKATTVAKAATTTARKVATNNAKAQTTATSMTTVFSTTNVRHLLPALTRWTFLLALSFVSIPGVPLHANAIKFCERGVSSLKLMKVY